MPPAILPLSPKMALPMALPDGGGGGPIGEIVALQPQLRRFAMSLCHNRAAAEDLTQDTVVLALRYIGKFEPGSSMAAWLCVIMRNTWLGGLRRRKREIEDPDDALAETLEQRAAQEGHVRLLEVADAFARLSRTHQAALLRVGVDGDSYADAAAAEGCPIGSMKSRVSRARQALTAALAD